MKRKKTKIMIILVILLLGLTIGYAILSSNLNINGTSTISNPTWDIHFENVQVKSGSVSTVTQVPTISQDRLSVSYAVTFNIPGDFYEFTVDVRNSGTIDGMIESVNSTINGLSPGELPEYMEYSLTYDDDTEIENNHLLTAGEYITYKIRLGFKRDIDPSQLPTSSETFNFTLRSLYKQADGNATPVHISKYQYAGYQTGPFVLGEESPSGDYIFDTYEDLKNFSNFNNFLKSYVIDGIVRELYVGYVLNGQPYYLRGGDNGAYHNDNKIILKNSFGEENCVEYTDESGTRYQCSKDRIVANSIDSGSVAAIANGFLCDVYFVDNNYGSYCAP